MVAFPGAVAFLASLVILKKNIKINLGALLPEGPLA